jgi:hypothetical protein
VFRPAEVSLGLRLLMTVLSWEADISMPGYAAGEYCGSLATVR